MAFLYQGAPQYTAAAGQTHSNRIATLPAGAWLREINVQGKVVLAYGQVALTTGVVPTHNLVAGVQYGASGYGGATITNGTPGTASWIDWAAGLPAVSSINDNNGTSPTNVMEGVGYALDFIWRGTLFFAAATDIYLEVGLDQGQPVHTSFAPFYMHWIGYNT